MSAPTTEHTSFKNSHLIYQRFNHTSELNALLIPLLESLGWQGTQRDIIEALPYNEHKLDIVEFRNTLARLGFESNYIAKSSKSISPKHLPCLVIPTDAASFVVLSKHDSGYTIFSGLETKPRQISSLPKQATLYTFTPWPESHYQTKNKQWFFDQIRNIRPLVKHTLILSFFINILMLATPLFLMSIYDKVIPAASGSMLINFSVGILIALLVTYVLQAHRNQIVHFVASQLDRQIAHAIIEKLLYLPAQFTNNASIGAQYAKIKDFQSIRDFIQSPMLITCLELPFVFIALLFMGWIQPQVLWAPITMLGLLTIIFFSLRERIESINQQLAKLKSKRHAFEVETLSQVSEIKAHALEASCLQRYQTLTHEYYQISYKLERLNTLTNNLSESVTYLSGLAVIVIGTHLVLQNQMTMGGLIACMMLIWRILAPLKALFAMLPHIKQLLASQHELNRLLQLPSERNLALDPSQALALKGPIRFENIDFFYQRNHPPALWHIDLHIPEKQITCVVGKNGSGKTTLLNLITRLFEPSNGTMYIGGVNIRQFNPNVLRYNIAYLPQQVEFFQGSILENLRYINISASDKEIDMLLNKLGIMHDILNLPDQINTELNEFTLRQLSNNFKQKLGLARALLKRADLILLDEPTNCMSHSEISELLSILDEKKQHATIIVATHCEVLTAHTDNLIQLEKGMLSSISNPKLLVNKVPNIA